MAGKRALQRWGLGAILGLAIGNWASAAVEIAHHDFSGNLSLQSRWHSANPVHAGQRSHASGFVADASLYLEDEMGRSFTLAPFFRYDAADSSRTHADLREAYFLAFGEFGEG